MFNFLRKNEKGQDAAEYALLIALIAIVIIAAVALLGTEISLIQRLARDNPDKFVFDLGRSLCGNMFRINLNYLAWTVENLGKVNVIRVPEDIKKEAIFALERMLQIG